MASLYDYQTGTILAPMSDTTVRLRGALDDAAAESPEGTVLARYTDGVWDYVRPDCREPGDAVVYAE